VISRTEMIEQILW